MTISVCVYLQLQPTSIHTESSITQDKQGNLQQTLPNQALWVTQTIEATLQQSLPNQAFHESTSN